MNKTNNLYMLFPILSFLNINIIMSAFSSRKYMIYISMYNIALKSLGR